MGHLPVLKPREVVALLEALGFSELRRGESLFLQKLLWASLPNKRQKLRDR
jgi:hypothetical protein